MKLDRQTEIKLKKALDIPSLEGLSLVDNRNGREYQYQRGRWHKISDNPPAVKALPQNALKKVGPAPPQIVEAIADKRKQVGRTYVIVEEDHEAGSRIEIARAKGVIHKGGGQLVLKDVYVSVADDSPLARPNEFKPIDEVIKEA